MDDRDQIELSRRRIEEEAQKNLETRLFRSYRNAGAIVIAVLGLFGVSLWKVLPDYVKGIIDGEIKSRVEEPIARAKRDAEEVTKDVGEILSAIRAQSEEVHTSLGRLSVKSNELLSEYGKTQAQLEDVRAQAQSLVSLSNDSSNALKYIATQDDLARLAATVGALAEQTSALAKSIQDLQTATGNAASIDVSQQDKIDEVKTEVEQITPPVQGSDVAGTVYVQFAGGKRDDIRRVSDELRKAGWSVPGEERLELAAKLSEVRYFYIEDEAKANRLAQDLATALSSMGLLLKPVTTRDASKNPNIKLPRRGIFEVWVEIPVK